MNNNKYQNDVDRLIQEGQQKQQEIEQQTASIVGQQQNNIQELIEQQQQKQQQIEQQTCSQNRLISIINWNEYQQNEQQVEQQVNSERTTNEQQMNTNNNDNNIYLYLLNKYRVEDRRNFSEYMKRTKALREDEYWDSLNKEEQMKLMSEI